MSEKRFYGWTLVGVFSFVYFLNTSFPMYGAGVINSYMAQSLNMSRSVLGLGVTVFSLTYGLLSPITAFSVNRLGCAAYADHRCDDYCIRVFGHELCGQRRHKLYFNIRMYHRARFWFGRDDSDAVGNHVMV